jgi:hypothetical protein
MHATKITLLIAAAAGAVWLAGCSTPETRIASSPEVFARLNPQQQAMVKAGQVGIGMEMAAVKIALGDPDRVTIRTNAAGQNQVWHYQEYAYYDGAFLYPSFYGGPYGGFHGRRFGGWGAWGGWGPYGDYPVAVYDKFRIEFDVNGRVASIRQEA